MFLFAIISTHVVAFEFIMNTDRSHVYSISVKREGVLWKNQEFLIKTWIEIFESFLGAIATYEPNGFFFAPELQ